ncbi:MAG: response regulator [Planctomycetaceae bacterium]|jgi:putative two-component system response regulator|nr:response regulator [Planctomycetaceae bacterium]
MQVLIVDDSQLALTALKGLLTAAGYEVLTAMNGKEGLKILEGSPCRMVISDWEMPIMNGLEFCRAVRAEEFTGYVYFLLLTSHGALDEMVQGLSAGADDFIAKPYKPDEVLARLRAGERILSLETRDVAIFALAKLAESRDVDTGAHLERVQYYCRALSQQMATLEKYQEVIDPEFIRLMFQTSPLHDIGKVGIPDSVLLKPGRLDPHEFEIMKTHTTIAAQTLDAALGKFPGVSFLKMARDIAATHHEKYDGTGYPNGLKEEQIPLCGRIIALADVYDALISKRVYKQAFTHDSAKSVILEGCGKHFDPDVVECFLAREDQFVSIRKRFAEDEDDESK